MDEGTAQDTPNDRGWYWDLLKERVVRWDERGPGDQVMGPYPSPEAAEHWRERVEQRNESWEEETEEWDEWNRWPEDDS